MPVALALLLLLAGACQSGDAAPRKTSLAKVGSRSFAPITVDAARSLIVVPPASRELLPPAKPGDLERVVAAYCVESTTLDETYAGLRQQLATAGFTDLDVREQDDMDGPYYLLSGKREGFSVSIEIMQSSVQPDCNAPGQIAVGIAVYRVKSAA